MQSSSWASAPPRKGKSKKGQMTELEKLFWNAILNEPGKTMLSETIDERFAHIDADTRSLTINSLLAKSLLTPQSTNSGLQFIAVSKTEASVVGQLENDESMVYVHIRDAQNEGIWTKQLKSRTGLHQTVLTRSLKSLEGKGLIKAVKSVKFPTRKIYMLKELTPSVELSGGPWYTDHELDTHFIEQLCMALDRYICSMTWPGSKGDRKKVSHHSQPILPTASMSSLPSAAKCLQWLRDKQITDVPLQVGDVQSLLNVLIYDGKIEKVPSLALGGATSRRRTSDEYTLEGKKDGYDTVSESNSSDESDADSAASDSDDADDHRRRRKRGKSSKKSEKARHRTKKRGKQSEYDEDSEKDSDARRKSIRLGSEDTEEDEEDDTEANSQGISTLENGLGLGSFVYRAIRPLQRYTGWTEVPCAQCPVFSFCQPGGPVNAESCIYLHDWIQHSKQEKDERLASDLSLEDEDMVLPNGVTDTPAHDSADDPDDVAQEDDEYSGEEV